MPKVLCGIIGIFIGVFLFGQAGAETSIIKRATKGAPLTWTEMDGNFENLRAGLDSHVSSTAQAILAVQLAQQGGTFGFTSKAAMDADLAHPAGTLAVVTNDATTDNNTFWIKLGASGAGSWQKSDMPPVLPLLDGRKYADFSAAVAAIGSTPSHLLISTAMTATAGTVSPATLRIQILPGGSIARNGQALTINGPLTNDGAITGTGTVTINGKYTGSGVLPAGVTFGAGAVAMVVPDWSDATADTDRVQWAVTTSQSSGWIPLGINRKYSLATAVYIDRGIDTTTNEFNIIGTGPDAGFYTDQAIKMFSSTIAHTSYPVSEFVTFKDIRFESSANTIDNYAVDGDKFFRMKFLNCYWRNIRLAKTENYFQTWHISNPNIRYVKGKWLEAVVAGADLQDGDVLDMHISDPIMEHGDVAESAFLVAAGQITGSDFRGGVIENITGPAIQTAGMQGGQIAGIHFEGISGQVIKLGQSSALSILGNTFALSTSPTYWAVDCGTSLNIFSAGNHSVGNLYDDSNMSTGADKLESYGDYSLSGQVQKTATGNVWGGAVTLTGCSNLSQITMYARKQGNLVTLSWGNTTCTSNSTGLSISGIPAGLLPSATRYMTTRIVNSGTTAMGLTIITTGGITFGKDLDGNLFTASGTKGVQAGSLTYALYP